MRRAPVALAALVISLVVPGCVSPAALDAGPGPLCAAPCEVPVDTGRDRAFEPTAALDPEDPSRAVIVSTVFYDDAERGSPIRFKVHLTSDAGASFETLRLEDLMPLDHPVRRYTLLADPMLRWLDDGSLLLFGMGSTGNPPETTGAAGMTSFDLWMARSLDGGRTWPEGQVIAEGSGFMSLASVGQYHDQPHVALGPDGTLLLGWAVVTTRAEDGGSVTQDIVASRSDDGGRTWSDPTLVQGGDYHNARPAISSGGTMFMAYRDYSVEESARPVLLSRSADGGVTWRAVDLGGMASITRPSVAVTGESVHILVGEPQDSGGALITLVTSPDGGSGTWSRTVLDEMEGDGPPIAQLAAASDGSLWATWHHVNADDTNEYRAWTRAPDGTEREQRISATPIGKNDPQGAIGWASLGDYNGLSATAGGTLAAWVSGEKSGQDVRAAWLD